VGAIINRQIFIVLLIWDKKYFRFAGGKAEKGGPMIKYMCSIWIVVLALGMGSITSFLKHRFKACVHQSS
jgi:hypothetical protein